MLPFTPFSCCCHHASHGQKSKLACLTHLKRADPILYQQLFFCISTSLATQRYIHTYSPFLWVWDYFSHWNLYAGRKEIITFTYAVYVYYRNPAALCVCVLHHHAVTRRHTDTQSTTATVIIAISQPYKCLAEQLHCHGGTITWDLPILWFFYRPNSSPTKCESTLQSYRGKHDVLPSTPTCQNTLMADNIFW